MQHKLILASGAPKPLRHYSQASRLGNLIFTSGQGPFDPETQQIVSFDIVEQTERTLDNLKAIIESEGSSFSHVLKVMVYVRRIADIGIVNEVFQRYFPNDPPPRAIVGADLARPAADGKPGMDVEIELVAYVPGDAE
jgi:2-iminobutanoate/2-iminopropanoate deaminase